MQLHEDFVMTPINELKPGLLLRYDTHPKEYLFEVTEITNIQVRLHYVVVPAREQAHIGKCYLFSLSFVINNFTKAL